MLAPHHRGLWNCPNARRHVSDMGSKTVCSFQAVRASEHCRISTAVPSSQHVANDNKCHDVETNAHIVRGLQTADCRLLAASCSPSSSPGDSAPTLGAHWPTPRLTWLHCQITGPESWRAGYRIGNEPSLTPADFLTDTDSRSQLAALNPSL